MSLLKRARVQRGWRLRDVCLLAKKKGVYLDTGNLSRIEQGKQKPSACLAACLAQIFSDCGVTEMHLLYPERYEAEQ